MKVGGEMSRRCMCAIVIVATGQSVACIAERTSGFPLYPQTDGPLDATRIARLSGYVLFVDDQDVSQRGGVFDLVPGCHVIRTPTRWGQTRYYGGAFIATTPQLTFALPMRAGHQYSIELIAGTPTGPTVPVDVKAFERNTRGELVQTFTWAKSPQDLERCAASAAQVESAAPAALSAQTAPATTSEPTATAPLVTIGADEPGSFPWPDAPPTPTAARSLDEAMAQSEVLIAHWKRVPEYRSHFVDGAADVPPDSGVAIARYIVRLQTAVQPALANCGSAPWRAAGADQPRSLELELVLDDSGALRDLGVIASSGSELFDAAALEAIARSAPFGPTSQSIRSSDGLVYLRWLLSNDPTYGCTLTARPHVQH